MKLILRFHYEDRDWLLIDEEQNDEYENDRFQVVPSDSITAHQLKDAIPEVKPRG